tara:strand:- start:991 stop:1611 length:621 start_codon:yes stop_codon:yes gene_type:complete
MVKLKELLGLRNMVYADKIKPKHQKKMNMKLERINPSVYVPKVTPPENDSKVTLDEVKYLAKIKPKLDFIKEKDDVVDTFMELVESTGVKIRKGELEQITEESAKIIYELKYHYNRPRPYQIAEFYGIDLNGTELDSMKTPSYPSGHAVQGYLIGEILSNLDKTNAILYRSVGEDIAHSRIVAKAHYPTDKTYGYKIAMELFKAYR